MASQQPSAMQDSWHGNCPQAHSDRFTRSASSTVEDRCPTPSCFGQRRCSRCEERAEPTRTH
eukprot:1571090-Rhodomonas_salina.1